MSLSLDLASRSYVETQLSEQSANKRRKYIRQQEDDMRLIKRITREQRKEDIRAAEHRLTMQALQLQEKQVALQFKNECTAAALEGRQKQQEAALKTAKHEAALRKLEREERIQEAEEQALIAEAKARAETAKRRCDVEIRKNDPIASTETLESWFASACTIGTSAVSNCSLS